MANGEATAIIYEIATNDLTASAAAISARLGIEPPEMPDFNKPDYQRAMQQRALADWLAQVNEALNQPALAAEGNSDATETQSAKSRRNR